jgi:hypothetical protein
MPPFIKLAFSTPGRPGSLKATVKRSAGGSWLNAAVAKINEHNSKIYLFIFQTSSFTIHVLLFLFYRCYYSSEPKAKPFRAKQLIKLCIWVRPVANDAFNGFAPNRFAF